MKKKLIAVVAYLLGIITAFGIMDYRYSIGSRYILEESPIEDEISIESLVESSCDDIEEVYRSLGKGFNIGNALDCCDWSYFGTSHITGFQAAFVYNTDPWTAWDASDYIYFDEDGNALITWDLSRLQSSDDSIADNIALQIVNHNTVFEGTSLNCKLKELELSIGAETVYDLLDGNKSDYELTVNKEVTDYVLFDLSNLELKTSDLKTATLNAWVEISDYYQDKIADIKNLEELWGNPQTSLDIVNAINKAGFNTVRVPVTYFNHVSKDGTIDKEFLDRVEEVVDWVIGCGMYCIIDVHHDSGNAGWIKASAENYNRKNETVAYIFRQIAERFKDKDEHLILEGLNEMVNENNQWENVPLADIQTMNRWNQLFVDTVRSTGGNNKSRYLLVNTYAALPREECFKNFVIPSDTVKNRIFVGIHCYIGLENMDDSFAVIDKYCNKYHIVIGEWAYDRSVPDRLSTTKNFLKEVNNRNIPAIYWDNGDENTMGILDRTECKWLFEDIVGAIVGR